jgi:alpha-amylase
MRLFRATLAILLVVAVVPARALAQAGFDDDRVMLQGFYWESCRHGHPDRFPDLGSKHWYQIVRENAGAIRDGRFDLVWLPPPSFAGEISAGYDPKQYFRFDTSYGTRDEHRAMLVALLQAGIEPVADLVLNHRTGTAAWTDFVAPDWGRWSIVAGDEAFSTPASEANGTPVTDRGHDEERPAPYSIGYGSSGRAFSYESCRDLDHSDDRVRRDVLRYLLALKSFGYRGWRYDMVHGYHARWIALYNLRTSPTFSVGEYDWGRKGEMRGWVWASAARPGDLGTASDVFDFATFFGMKDRKTNPVGFYDLDTGVGLEGDRTDGIDWKQRAVTFVENHDTGFRTGFDGNPERDHEADSFANGTEVERAYAYVLTHPGVPCVYWKHYFDWGSDLRARIAALVNARKVAGVTSGSHVDPQDNARERGVYAARVVGRNGALYVRIGGDDATWEPSASGYAGYREYARGDGWVVWVGLPGNPPVRRAPAKPSLPVPVARDPSTVSVPDAWLRM